MATVSQSTGRWASSVHCNGNLRLNLVTHHQLINKKDSRGTHIPTKAIWAKTWYVMAATSNIKFNSTITSWSRTPLELHKKRSEHLNCCSVITNAYVRGPGICQTIKHGKVKIHFFKREPQKIPRPQNESLNLQRNLSTVIQKPKHIQ